jgi:hypothetical protein
LKQYFTTIDDEAHFKILEDANNYITKEILNVRKSIEDLDKEISNTKKVIREVTSKLG